jgi:hypothetical protein
VKPFVKPILLAVVSAALLGVSCSNNNNTTAPTQPVAPPTVLGQPFNGVLPVGGFKFFSFSIGVYGTVNISLTSLSGDGVSPGTTVALGFGHPAGTDCNATSVNTQATATQPQITSAYDVGVWCVRISDVGNLTAPANFTISIDHP